MTAAPTEPYAPDLGPIIEHADERPITVEELIRWVHDHACVARDLRGKSWPIGRPHDPLCDTARLLAEDQRHLAATAWPRLSPPSRQWGNPDGCATPRPADGAPVTDTAASSKSAGRGNT